MRSLPLPQQLSCTLPPRQTRAQSLSAGGEVQRQLPENVTRTMSLEAKSQPPARCLPMEYARAQGAPRPEADQMATQQGADGPNVATRVAMPLQVNRADTVSEPAPPVPAPYPNISQTAVPPAPAAPVSGRANLPVAAALPIVEAVARGISGAAGYAYIGEDPATAGVRFGMLGQRLDTGDMAGVFATAQRRDADRFAVALGADANALLTAINADSAVARKAPVNGNPLWSPAWKPRLMTIASTPLFVAAQNEYAVAAQLEPVAALVLSNAALINGAALAMALDICTECGTPDGLAKITAALAANPDSNAAFMAALVRSVPETKTRLPLLNRNDRLLKWRPDPGATP